MTPHRSPLSAIPFEWGYWELKTIPGNRVSKGMSQKTKGVGRKIERSAEAKRTHHWTRLRALGPVPTVQISQNFTYLVL